MANSDLAQWLGFPRRDLQISGRNAIIIAPHRALSHRPWLWRAEFFGEEPEPDLALLAEGFHLAYLDTQHMFGSEQAMGHWERFYECLHQDFHLAPKAGLIAISRGGLYAYHWAFLHPERVACIYADAPVCDIRSWPAPGSAAGRGSPDEWQRFIKHLGFESEQAALAYDRNPIDLLEPIARARIPLLHVCGDADDVVPYEENTAVLAQRYRALGGEIQVILKPGVGHHPHGLSDPRPIIDFIRRHNAGAG